MEVKKLDEALFLSSEALSLLSKYPNSSSSPSDAIAQLQSLCKALLSCLSILQGLERDHHKQYEIQYINREEDERALCAEQLRFSERMTSVYGLVSIVLSQVSHFNVDGEGGNQEEGKEKGAVDTADREEEPTEDVVSLESVYGCDEAKKILLQTIYFPLTFPFLFVAPRKPIQKILFYGPPGTGKTLLANAAAHSVSRALSQKIPFFTLTASQLLDKYVGESEKQIQRVFLDAQQFVSRNANRKCILFFDEIDALCGQRGSEKESELSRRVKTELLLALQSVNKDVNASIIIIAATNLPWEIDSAIRRRFDRFVYVGLPDATVRFKILYDHFSRTDHRITSDNVEAFIHLDSVQLCSPSDLVGIIRHTLMKPYDAYFHNVGDGTSRLTLREAGDMDWELYDDHTSLEGPYHIPSLRRDRQQYVKWYVVCDPDHPDRIDSDYHLLRTVNAVQQGHDGGTLNICEDQLLLPPILYDHLTEALGDFIPTVTTDGLRRYEEWGRP